MSGYKGYKRSIVLDFDYDSVKKGVPDVNRQMALLNAEFKKAAEQAKGAGNEYDKLGVLQEKLSGQIKLQGDKVRVLTDELNKLQSSENKNGKAIAQKTIELKNAEAAYLKLQNELAMVTAKMDNFGVSAATAGDKMRLLEAENDLAISQYNKKTTVIAKLEQQQSFYTGKLSLQKEEVARLRDELKTLTDTESQNEKAITKKAAELKKAEASYNSLKAEVAETTKELEKQKQQIGLTREQWEKLSDKTKTVGTSMSTYLTVPIAAAGTAAFKLASDMTETLSKVDVAFNENSEAVKIWSETSLEKMGLAQQTALDMAAGYAAMANGMGINSEKTLEMSQSLTQLSADLSSYFNTSSEMANTALTGVFTGETEALKKYGVVMTEANLQQYAYTQGVRKKVSEMTQAEKVILRYNFVMDAAADAQGDFSRTSDSASNQTKLFKESIKELGTSFGENILPIITPVIAFFNDVIQGLAKMGDGTKKFLTIALMGAAAIGPVLLVISQLASMINNISGAVKTVKTGMEGLSKAGSLFNSTVGNATYITFVKWAAVIIGVVLAITALVVAINYLIGRGKEMNNALEDITNSTGSMKKNLNQQINSAGKQSYAIGTRYHKGGTALVGEYGPEEVWLPEGARVKTADETRKSVQAADNSRVESLLGRILDKLDSMEESIDEQPRKQQQLIRMGAV